MKCSNCGAEIPNNAKFCEFCGSQISIEMKREQEQLRKEGCPKCGSSNVTFNREKQREVKGKKGTTIVCNTVGVCKDCGNTWYIENSEPAKKRRTWLWVLGWLFIFPVPLTILMLRPTSKLDKKIRYVIIAVAWIIYIALVWTNKGSDTGAQENRNNVISSENENSYTPSIDEEVPIQVNSEVEDSEKVQDTSEGEDSEDNLDASTVNPDLKQFLDSYEAFMNEYCDFIQNYDSSDIEMLVQYTELMQKYADFAEKADSYDTDKMSAVDSEYYIEVMARINIKLASIAYTQE